MIIPEKITGKKWPPLQPMFTQNAVTAIFANPVAISTVAVMVVQTESSDSVWASPENSVNGRTIPHIPSTRPPITALATSLSPSRPDARRNRLSSTRNSHPPTAPTRHTGTIHRSSLSPNSMSP